MLLELHLNDVVIAENLMVYYYKEDSLFST